MPTSPLNPTQTEIALIRSRLLTLEQTAEDIVPACVHSDANWQPIILCVNQPIPSITYHYLGDNPTAHEDAFSLVRAALDAACTKYCFAGNRREKCWTLSVDYRLDEVVFATIHFLSPAEFDSSQRLPPVIYDGPSNPIPQFRESL